MKCVIQWIDEQGNRTPDDNEAIQYCRIKAHIFERPVDCPPNISDIWASYDIPVPASSWWPICAEHSKRLAANWETKPLDWDDDCVACRLDRAHDQHDCELCSGCIWGEE